MDALVNGTLAVLKEGKSEKYPQVSWNVLQHDGWDERRLQRYIHLALHVKVDAKDEYGFYQLLEFLSGLLGFEQFKTPVNPHLSVEVLPVKKIVAGTLPSNTTTRIGNLEIRGVSSGWTDDSSDSTYKAFRSILIYY
jgi:hypothetical protein